MRSSTRSAAVRAAPSGDAPRRPGGVPGDRARRRPRRTPVLAGTSDASRQQVNEGAIALPGVADAREHEQSQPDGVDHGLQRQRRRRLRQLAGHHVDCRRARRLGPAPACCRRAPIPACSRSARRPAGRSGPSCSGDPVRRRRARPRRTAASASPLPAGQHVQLPASFFCRSAGSTSTFDVLKMPAIDAQPDVEGVQTIPIRRGATGQSTDQWQRDRSASVSAAVTVTVGARTAAAARRRRRSGASVRDRHAAPTATAAGAAAPTRAARRFCSRLVGSGGVRRRPPDRRHGHRHHPRPRRRRRAARRGRPRLPLRRGRRRHPAGRRGRGLPVRRRRPRPARSGRPAAIGSTARPATTTSSADSARDRLSGDGGADLIDARDASVARPAPGRPCHLRRRARRRPGGFSRPTSLLTARRVQRRR